MKKIKSFYELNEFFNDKKIIQMKSGEICVKLYDILSLLLKGEYNRIYAELYSNYDMLYQMFKSDEDTVEFLETIRIASIEKNFYNIYNPINRIITKLIEANYKK